METFFLKLVEAMGGGLGAVVIAALGWANWIQYRAANTQRDKMLEWSEAARERESVLVEKMMQAQHTGAQAIAMNTEVTRQAIRVMEDRR